MSLPDDGTLHGSPATADDAQLRLHPGSWLFVLLQQARQFFIPLVALVVFGQRGDRDDHYGLLISLAVIGVLVAVSVMQYMTYRYRLGADAIHIRSGLLERSWRDIPYARVHNVVLHQSVLHRMFGVAEVRLESAGGARSEAQMRVLRLDRALALEQRVRHGAHAPSVAATEMAHSAAAPPQRLLSLSTVEVIRLGLISNRGMVVVAAAFGVLYQAFPQRAVNQFIANNGEQAYRYAWPAPGTGGDRGGGLVAGAGAAAGDAPAVGGAGAGAVPRLYPERDRTPPHHRTRPAHAGAHQHHAAAHPGLDAARRFPASRAAAAPVAGGHRRFAAAGRTRPRLPRPRSDRYAAGLR